MPQLNNSPEGLSALSPIPLNEKIDKTGDDNQSSASDDSSDSTYESPSSFDSDDSSDCDSSEKSDSECSEGDDSDDEDDGSEDGADAKKLEKAGDGEGEIGVGGEDDDDDDGSESESGGESESNDEEEDEDGEAAEDSEQESEGAGETLATTPSANEPERGYLTGAEIRQKLQSARTPKQKPLSRFSGWSRRRSGKRHRTPKESAQPSYQPSFFVQRPLDQFAVIRRQGRRRSSINLLPLEVLREIFTYLPWLPPAETRVHTHPFAIPVVMGAGDASAEPCHPSGDESSCILDQLTPNGCARFCEATRLWQFHSVLGVCRQWRDVALACPSFWCRIPTDGPRKWTTRALQKSAGDLIHFNFLGGEHEDYQKLHDVLDHLPRIRQLSLQFSTADTARVALLNSSLTATPAPELEELSIDYSKVKSMTVPGPSDIFRGQAPPRLHTLSLLNLTIPGTSPLFAPTLTRLSIATSENTWATSQDMRDVFSRLPLLEYLKMKQCCPLEMYATHCPAPPNPVHFPALQHLFIEDFVEPVVHLISNFNLLSSTSMELRFIYYQYDSCYAVERAYKKALPMIARHFGPVEREGGSFSSFKMRMWYDNPHYVLLQFQANEDARLKSPSIPRTFDVGIVADYLESSDRHFSFIQSLAEVLPVSQALDLSFFQQGTLNDVSRARFWTYYYVTKWVALFSRARCVRNIKLSGTEPMDFICFLHTYEVIRDRPVFSQIESVKILLAALSYGVGWAGSRMGRDDDVTIYDKINDILEVRIKTGRPFRLIVVLPDDDFRNTGKFTKSKEEYCMALFKELQRRHGEDIVNLLEAPSAT